MSSSTPIRSPAAPWPATTSRSSPAGSLPASSTHTRMSSITDVWRAWRRSGARVRRVMLPSRPSHRHWKKQNPKVS